ncbi:MAG: hypothetical protein JWM53_1668 [bacterium]|nr:hypothetical protein [bacterium]
MRGVLVVLLVMMTVTSAGSTARAAPAGAELHAAEVDHLLKSGRDLRKTGEVLVGVGVADAVVATIVGAFAFMSATVTLGDAPPGSVPQPSESPALLAAAIGLGVSTAVLLAIGIPLMAEGDARMARARKLVGARSVRLAAVPGGGLELTW